MKQALSPKKARIVGQLRTVAFGLGASTLSLACSFGAIDDPNQGFEDLGSNPTPAATDDGVGPQVDGQAAPSTSDDVDTTDTVTTPRDPNDPMSSLADPTQAEQDFSDSADFSTPLGQQVVGILENNCGACHSNGVKSGDMDYILDLGSLIENGKIVPGSKDNSPLFTRMQLGSMPPAFIQDQRPSRGDVDLVGQFITELGAGDGPACDPVDFLSYDDMFTMMQQDVLQLDVEDRPFTRYLQVSYASNAGLCGLDLDSQRFALFKMINSVSLNPKITKPVAIDANQLVFRIDIRDYDWDRGIDINFDGVDDFADAWDAILDSIGNYAVPFTGDQADVLNQETGTDVPMIPVNAFVQEAARNSLYYALTTGTRSIAEFEANIGVDVQENIDQNEIMRAGVKTSGVSKQDRHITREDNGVSGGLAYWLSFDFEDINGNDSIYSNPIDFAFAGGEAIYNLPNGMQAYLVANAAGALLDAAPNDVVQDPAQNNGLVVNGASCHSCHNAGLIPFSDTVKPYVMSNRLDFDAETYDDVLQQFPDPAVFDAQAQADSELHLRSAEKAGVPRGTPDAVSRVFLQFQLGDVSTSLAAGELGVTPAELVANANRLDPRFDFENAEGRTDRNTFTNAFVDSLCIMQSSSQNQPANCQ
jgi:serine/threonine-protein kinase